jgi:hypothetical protein
VTTTPALWYKESKWFVIPEWPIEPNIDKYSTPMDYYNSIVNEWVFLCDKAKESAIEVGNQADVHCLFLDEVRYFESVHLKEDTVHPFIKPYLEYEIQRKRILCPDNIDGCEVLHTIEVAILKPSSKAPEKKKSLSKMGSELIEPVMSKAPESVKPDFREIAIALHNYVNELQKEIEELKRIGDLRLEALKSITYKTSNNAIFIGQYGDTEVTEIVYKALE